ncbi:restriction endonuclease [Paenibacillus sp. GCM10027626]|uniref:restriction endonuclease n=1 Tax=Paenibacillus sp. GCM10027626 TaxID=3273411 RepID=UPI003625ECA0
MSKKKRKQQKELEKLIEGLLILCLVGAFLLVYNATKSFAAAGVAAALVVGIFIAIQLYRNLLYAERMKKSGIKDIDEMDGRQFEHYLGYLFQAYGYKVQVTRAAGDYGADLVLTKAGKKIVVQAKRYSKTVGLKAVQEVKAAIAHYQASEGWVIANREYSDEAYSLAKSNGIRLINREGLIEMILKLNPGAAPSAKAVKQQLPQENRKCTRCGSNMVLRKGPKGEFYGCSSYPKCRNIANVK